MQEVGCIASPGDLLLRPTVCNQTRNPWLKELMEESCWRPCLVEELVEGLPGEGRLSWGRWSLTLKWSSHSLPLLVEYCYHKLPAFGILTDYYICFTTCWSKSSTVCSRPGVSFIKLCVGSLLKMCVRPEAKFCVRQKIFRFIKHCVRTPVRNLCFINHILTTIVRSWISFTFRPLHAPF